MIEAKSRAGTRMRALVLEDEWPARDYLIELLVGSNAVEVVAAVATADEARQALGPGGVGADVAFVDIHLATSTGQDAGLDIVRQFSGMRGAPLFVIATALKHHAVSAYDLDVVDYLLKPFSEERVAQCLARITRRRLPPVVVNRARVAARSKNGLVFLQPSDAWALEASERATFVHSAAGRFDLDLTLAAIESALGIGWLRVHRNWVVNIERVMALERDEVGSTLVLGDTSAAECVTVRVPVGRDKSQSVRDALLKGTTGVRHR